MSLPVKRALIRFLLCAAFGMVLEMLASAVHGACRHNWTLFGHSSFWMIIDYGLLGILVGPIATPLRRWRLPLPGRAFVYMLLIYLVEYVSGRIFTACGLKIWSYYDRYNLHHQITLTLAPAWYLLGLFAETLYRKTDAVAVTLLRGFTAAELEQAPRQT
ncbi:MAG: hypothetical protein WC708_07915 [Lentisphaeria bacterium]